MFSYHVCVFGVCMAPPDNAEKTYTEAAGCACLPNCQNLAQQIVNNALPISWRHDRGHWD